MIGKTAIVNPNADGTYSLKAIIYRETKEYWVIRDEKENDVYLDKQNRMRGRATTLSRIYVSKWMLEGEDIPLTVWERKAKEAAILRQAKDERDRLVDALTPSRKTKCAHIGEYSFPFVLMDDDNNEVTHTVDVPWTTIKEIMAAIMSNAKVKPDST